MGEDIFALVAKIWIRRVAAKAAEEVAGGGTRMAMCMTSPPSEATNIAQEAACSAVSSVINVGPVSAGAAGLLAAGAGVATGGAIAGTLAGSEKTEHLSNQYNNSNDEIQKSAAAGRDAATNATAQAQQQ